MEEQGPTPDTATTSTVEKTSTPLRDRQVSVKKLGVVVGVLAVLGLTFYGGMLFENQRISSGIDEAFGDFEDGSSDASATDEEAEDIEDPADNVTYGPEDFSVKLTTSAQECFGTAGCNTTLKVEPIFEGTEFSSKSWDITYEVRGGADGPIVDTFTISDDQFNFNPEVFVSIPNADSEVTTEITNVVESY